MADQAFRFDELPDAPLIVDAVYVGGVARNRAGGHEFTNDPIQRLLGVKSQGGIRPRRRIDGQWPFVILKSTGAEIDWPDQLDPTTGHYTYYGDNRTVGHQLLDKQGNRLLDEVYSNVLAERRNQIPPFLLFRSAGPGRDVRFLGAAAPGYPGLVPSEILIPKWYFSSDGQRFQNYEAHFTLMDMPVPRAWLNDLAAGKWDSPACPAPWRRWIQAGKYEPLRASPMQGVRKKHSQLPAAGGEDINMLHCIHAHFSEDPFKFEKFAGDLFTWHKPDMGGEIDYTRPYKDGGRDAVGRIRAGIGEPALIGEFALEAKCYHPDHGCGVGEIGRLAGRLRNRMFGVFVTTSYVNSQAYEEIRLEDRHPIAIIAGKDIVEIIKRRGYVNSAQVKGWLQAQYPADQ